METVMLAFLNMSFMLQYVYYIFCECHTDISTIHLFREIITVNHLMKFYGKKNKTRTLHSNNFSFKCMYMYQVKLNK